jgi:hypothetical protein
VTGRLREDLLCHTDEHLVASGDGLPLRGLPVRVADSIVQRTPSKVVNGRVAGPSRCPQTKGQRTTVRSALFQATAIVSTV